MWFAVGSSLTPAPESDKPPFRFGKGVLGKGFDGAFWEGVGRRGGGRVRVAGRSCTPREEKAKREQKAKSKFLFGCRDGEAVGTRAVMPTCAQIKAKAEKRVEKKAEVGDRHAFGSVQPEGQRTNRRRKGVSPGQQLTKASQRAASPGPAA